LFLISCIISKSYMEGIRIILQDKKIFTSGKFVAIIATLCCLLWGSAYPAVKTGYLLFNIELSDIASKFVFAGYRFTASGVIVLIISALSGKKVFKLSRNNIGNLFILGLIQTTMQYIFFYIGLANTTGVKSSIMNSTATFFSVILAHFLYKNDKLTRKRVIGCILGFIGILVVNFSTDLLNFSFSIKGEGFVIISAFMFGVAAIYTKKITKNMDVIVATGYSLFIGGILLILLGTLFGGKIENFTIASSSLLIYLALLSAAAFSMWNLLLKYNKVVSVSVYNLLTPIFGAILSSIFLGETILEFKNIVALVLVCLGIWCVNKKGA